MFSGLIVAIGWEHSLESSPSYPMHLPLISRPILRRLTMARFTPDFPDTRSSSTPWIGPKTTGYFCRSPPIGPRDFGTFEKKLSSTSR
jgi:hypothetical protein